MGKENARLESEGDIKPGVRQRLEFIDFRLFWAGRINRSDLMGWFRISPQQASTDLDRYAEIAEGNLAYDRVQKTFVRAPGYRPFFIATMHNRYLMQIQAMKHGWLEQRQTWFDEVPPSEVVSLEHATVQEDVLMAIVDAIRDGLELDVEYWPMSDKPATVRRIAPHALAYADRRWHARCWNRENGDFRDFNITRMASPANYAKSPVNSAHDLEWHTWAAMRIEPNPALSPYDRDAVRREFGFAEEAKEVRTRLALLFYFRMAYSLDQGAGHQTDPKPRRLILTNAAELEELRQAARRMSVVALQGGAA